MTIKGVFIRFSLTYIVLIIALLIINSFLEYWGISPIGSIGFMLLITSTMYACDAFAKKNKRYFSPEEKKKIIIGFIIVSILIEVILMAISGMASKLGGNGLLIVFGIMLIFNPLLIYIFVGLVGIGARKKYGINKDEVKLSNNGNADEVIQSHNIIPKETFRTLWAMWILCVLSLLVVIYVGYTLGNQIKEPVHIEGRIILFYIILIITLLISYLLRKRMLHVKNADSSIISIAASHVDKTAYVRKYFLAVMVSFLFAFFIEIYGIILFYSGGNFLNLFIFVAISFICLCYYRPKENEFNSMVLSIQNNNALYQDKPQ